MIEKEIKKRIGKLRESDLTIKEIAKALEISESSVKKYSSGNYNKDIKSGITLTKTNPLNESWMKRLFGDDWNDNNELMQLFFDLNRLASETKERDLEAFLVKIEFMIRQYHRYSNNPLKLYDFSLNVASSMTFISEKFDIELFVNQIEDFIDKSIFLDKLDEVINERKQEKTELDEKLINLQIEINNLTNAKTIFTKKLLDNPAERKLEDAVRTNQKLQILIQKIAKKGLSYKIQFEQVNQEKFLLENMFQRINLTFPEEVRSIVEEIKKEELQCPKTTIS